MIKLKNVIVFVIMLLGIIALAWTISDGTTDSTRWWNNSILQWEPAGNPPLSDDSISHYFVDSAYRSLWVEGERDTSLWILWEISPELTKEWYDNEASEEPFFESEEWQWLSGEIAFQFYLDIFAPIFALPKEDQVIDSAKFYFQTEYDSDIPIYPSTSGDSMWLKYWTGGGGRWIVKTDSGWVDTKNGEIIWGW